MTPARLVAVSLFLFCAAMTTLLVRSVYWPEESRLSSVAPGVPVELFLKRSEGTSLDIWEANRITGSLYLNPSSLIDRRDGRRGGTIRIEATIRLKQPVLGAVLLRIHGSCFYSTGGEADDLDLAFSLASVPAINIAVKQPAGDQWPSVTLTRGSETLFKSTGGQTADDANSQLVNLVTAAAGLSPDALTARGAAQPPLVRSGRITAGGEEFDGYYIAPGGESGESFRLYIANTGEVLRIETPFSRDSELGLRFLSQALRPAGAEVPDLNFFGTPAGKKP